MLSFLCFCFNISLLSGHDHALSMHICTFELNCDGMLQKGCNYESKEADQEDNMLSSHVKNEVDDSEQTVCY